MSQHVVYAQAEGLAIAPHDQRVMRQRIAAGDVQQFAQPAQGQHAVYPPHPPL